VLPGNADLILIKGSGSLTESQELLDSEHKSGRHNTSYILGKSDENWSFPTYFNLNKSALNGSAAIDTPMKVLLESALGKTSVGLVNSEFIANASAAPDVTFTMMEVGDVSAKQAIGGYVEESEFNLPGDGQAMANFSGKAGSVTIVGIGKSTTIQAATNVFTCDDVGEGKNFPIGSYVMIIKADGVTRSTDTATLTARKVTAVTAGAVTLDGAALTADSNGGPSTPVYLVYYEPPAPVAVDAPETGLVGDIISTKLPAGYCFRSLTIKCTNNHEPVDYCFGTKGLHAPFYIASGRLMVTASAELNWSKKIVSFYNRVKANESVDILAVLGAPTGRRFEFSLPKIYFSVPAVETPESGSIPVTFEGKGYQTVLDAADEIEVRVM
jgi:hypothetical protein